MEGYYSFLNIDQTEFGAHMSRSLPFFTFGVTGFTIIQHSVYQFRLLETMIRASYWPLQMVIARKVA